MRVLVISKEGDALGVAQRLALEDNDVSVYVAEPRFRLAGRGIVNRVSSWSAAAAKADLLVVDCVGLGKYESRLRALGRPLIGCCERLDLIELDRGRGMRMFKTAGVKTPETWEFANTAEADRIRRREPWQTGFVIKPNNNVSTSKTMVVKDETMWDHSLKQISPDSTGILQRVLNGIEVSTEGWFNGREWVKPFNHTFEEKRFLAGDLGVNTGCMGNVVLNAGDSNRLTRETVERLGELLAHLQYRGPVDVNCIVTKDGAFALEITSRMGYDAVEALIEGLEEPVGEMLFDVASGTRTQMPLTEDTMIAVRLSVPPWPARKPDQTSNGEPVNGIDEAALPHLFLTDVYKDGEQYYTAAGDGVLLKATAIGRARRNGSIDDLTYEARRRVYRTLDKISVSSKQYRTDIGSRVNSQVAQLKQWGWL